MNDSLGDRMKQYENCFRYKLPNRSYTIIRVDGKAFHSYTKGLKRPFDEGLIADMDRTAIYLCKNIMGAKLAYVQSDEITIVMTDFDDIGTQAWFDNNLQKMVSVAASMATAKFNQLRYVRACNDFGEDFINGDDIAAINFAMFDARVFQIPQKVEVENCLIWRQQDATRNSISSVAQSLYSHKELEGVDSDGKQELIFQKGINWNDLDDKLKRGRVIKKVRYVNGVNTDTTPLDREIEINDTIRNKWESTSCPIFTQDRDFLRSLIPDNI